MTDSAEASGGAPTNVSDTERIIATLNSFGATMDTHAQTLQRQQEIVYKHEHMLMELLQEVRNLTSLPPLPPSPPPARTTQPAPPVPGHEPRLPAPQRYNGNPGGCRGFLTQCDLAFELQPSMFPSDRSQIAYLINLMTEKALSWATAVWGQQGAICSDYKAFKEEMLRVFDQTAVGQEAAKKILQLRQGQGTVADYAITFRTLAADCGWNEQALVSVFYHGLSDDLKDGLASIGCPKGFEALVAQSMQLDNRLRERRRDQAQPHRSVVLPTASCSTSPTSLEEPEPMQVGATRLPLAERERRRRERCCHYCGKPDHFRASCPELRGKDQPRQAKGGL